MPEATDHYFVQLNGEILTFISIEQDLQTKDHTINKATYPLDTWKLIDSLTASFWSKPEVIPQKLGVSDGGATEMKGIKNGKSHSVYSSNASTQDPEFDKTAKVISLHLSGNSKLKSIYQ